MCIKDEKIAKNVKDKLTLTHKIPESQIKHIKHCGIFELQMDPKEMADLWRKSDFANETFNECLEKSLKHRYKISHNYMLCNLEHSLFSVLESSEKFLYQHYEDKEPSFPMIAVSYSLGRSGTTLMTQFLASLKLFAYAPNFLKASPYTILNGFIQYSNILRTFGNERESSYESYFGNTDKDGLLGEYELSISTIPGENIYTLPLRDYDDDIVRRARAYYAGIAAIMQKPFSEKVNATCIRLLEQICQKTLYIELYRDIYTHTLALVNLYKSLPAYTPNDNGDTLDNAYHMFFKKKYKKEILFSKDPIKYTAITLKNAMRLREREIQNVPESRRIKITYEEFCKNPKSFYGEIIERLKALGLDYSNEPYRGQESFTISNRIPDKETVAIVDSVFSNDEYNIDFDKGE